MRLSSVLAIGLLTAVTGPVGCEARAAEPRVPVVVELFTSEGCSSCPSADAVLADIEAAQPIGGVEIVPLAFHVDYWNELGWTDPFSSAKYTERQRGYVRALKTPSAYTPEAIVDGRADVVASRREALLRMIQESRQKPKVRLAIEEVTRDARGAIVVNVRADRAVDVAPREPPTLIVALTQNEAVVNVARGENSGRRLRHTAIVRALVHAGEFNATTAHVVLTPPSDAPAASVDYRVVALLEDPSTHAILGVGTKAIARR